MIALAEDFIIIVPDLLSNQKSYQICVLNSCQRKSDYFAHRFKEDTNINKIYSGIIVEIYLEVTIHLYARHMKIEISY